MNDVGWFDRTVATTIETPEHLLHVPCREHVVEVLEEKVETVPSQNANDAFRVVFRQRVRVHNLFADARESTSRGHVPVEPSVPCCFGHLPEAAYSVQEDQVALFPRGGNSFLWSL